MKALGDIFNIKYGNQFDLNKMELVSLEEKAINFVSRTAKNNGVASKVKKLDKNVHFSAGDITVALGGSVLSSFVQENEFYTGQNVAVLSNSDLTIKEKLFYCVVIKKNAYRYQACGREANKTLSKILVPKIEEIPSWVNELEIPEKENFSHPKKTDSDLKLSIDKWKSFKYEELFLIERGRGARKSEVTETGSTAFISASEFNNGLTGWTNHEAVHKSGVISVVRNGNSVASAFYQETDFCSTEDVHIFTPKFEINKFIALFLCTLIRKEKYRFNYGRKWGIARMKESIIKLPVTNAGEPNWQFMEDYIKSLPYSSNLADN